MLLGEGAPLRNMLQPQSLFVLLTLLTEPCSSMNTPSLLHTTCCGLCQPVHRSERCINSDFPEPPQKAVNANRRGD